MRREGDTYHVVTGNMRLRYMIDYLGKARVRDAGSGESFYVAYAPYDLSRPIEEQKDRPLVRVAGP